MRIISVSIPYPRPAHHHDGLFVQRRLAALARRADVSVVSPQPWFPMVHRASVPYGAGLADDPPVTRPRMFYIPGALKGLDGHWLRRCLLKECRRAERSGPVDLLDAQFEYPEAVGAVRVAQFLGVPAFVTLRGLLTKYLQTRARRKQCLQALHDATGIISVAHSLKRTAEEHGVDGSKIRVIPNAIDVRTYSPAPQAEARGLLGLELGVRVIVAVGHVQPVKGQHDLIAALAQTKARQGLVRLMLIGNEQYDRGYTRSLQRQIAALGLANEVRFVGKQSPEQVACWLRAADLFALPSYHEGCCNALLEALACGTPVVATPVGDNRSYVGRHCGILAPVGDVAALAAAVDEALSRTWDRATISAGVSSWTWDDVAVATLDFYQERVERITRRSA